MSWLKKYKNGGPIDTTQSNNLPKDYDRFKVFNRSLPENLRDDNYQYGRSDNYNLYGMWESVGKPDKFQDVQDTEYFPLQSDGTYHGFSIGLNGEFLKPKNHPTTWMEYASGALSPDLKDMTVIQNENGRLQYVPKKMANGGLIKRADGSYSKRGLWDNIRKNKGSGKKPTAEMLKQERKIKAQEKAYGGWLNQYDEGGPIEPEPPVFGGTLRPIEVTPWSKYEKRGKLSPKEVYYAEEVLPNAVRQGQKDFLNHPVSKMTAGILGGITGGGLLGTYIPASASVAPLVTATGKAINAPILGTPGLTANNLLAATGAAISANQVVDPESATRTSIDKAIEDPTLGNIVSATGNTGLTALGFVGLPYKQGAVSLADDVLNIPNAAKTGLREGIDLVHPIGRKLKEIEKRGIAQGLSPEAIKNQQMQEIGITSLQREGYFPGVSEVLSEYLVPYSYENPAKRLLQIPKKVIKGETNTKKLAELNKVIQDKGENTISKSRYDAWRMYSGLPQKYGTFRIAETSPVNHPSYTQNQLNKLEKFSLNDERMLLNDLPQEYDNAKFFYNDKDLLNNTDVLKYRLKLINDLENKNIHFPQSDFNTTNVMGGYNRRFFDNKVEYNDIWDLDLNGIKVDKYYGKPFMSHGQLNYSFEPAKKEIQFLLDKAEFLQKNSNILKENKTSKKLASFYKDYNNIINNVNYPGTLKNMDSMSKKQMGGWLNKYN
jgi:hypothetical protein